MSSYGERLKDPRWQQVRLKVFKRDDWKCICCRAASETLNVHHLEYGKDPWDTPVENLITLCAECHSNFEGEIKHVRSAMRSHLKMEATWKFAELLNKGLEDELNSMFVAFRRRPDVINELVHRAWAYNVEWMEIHYPNWSVGKFNDAGVNI